MLPIKQRLASLEVLLEQDYEKLSYFQLELGKLSHAPSKFELSQRIKTEVLPSLHEHELEYWGLLFEGRYLSVFFIYKPDARTAIIVSARDMSKKERKAYGRK